MWTVQTHTGICTDSTSNGPFLWSWSQNPIVSDSGLADRSANKAEDLAIKFSDRYTVTQLKHLCTTLYLLWILTCSLHRVGELDSVSSVQKFHFSMNISCLQIAQQSGAESLSAYSQRGEQTFPQQQTELVYPDAQRHRLLRLAAGKHWAWKWTWLQARR